MASIAGGSKPSRATGGSGRTSNDSLPSLPSDDEWDGQKQNTPPPGELWAQEKRSQRRMGTAGTLGQGRTAREDGTLSSANNHLSDSDGWSFRHDARTPTSKPEVPYTKYRDDGYTSSQTKCAYVFAASLSTQERDTDMLLIPGATPLDSNDRTMSGALQAGTTVPSSGDGSMESQPSASFPGRRKTESPSDATGNTSEAGKDPVGIRKRLANLRSTFGKAGGKPK
jgi:hypothetical protein